MTAMIELANAEKTFTMHLQGGVELPVVRGVSFHADPGECVVLSGPSGAGKSSILKMIFGNYRCDSGRIGIRHNGRVVDLATAEPRQVLSIRRSTIGYVSQFLRAVPRVATIDVVAVVTRWFGGTLLGTGGLVKAYSDAVRAALDEAHLVHYERQVRLTCQVTLADVGRVENALRAAGFVVADVDYATHAAAGCAGLEVAAPSDALGRADTALAELTSGEAAFERVGQTWAAKG